jgi:hypothetical protein
LLHFGDCCPKSRTSRIAHAPIGNGRQRAGRAASCEQSEQQVREALVAQWQNFPAADKQSRIAEPRIGGFPSYVQALVCLEIARDARAMNAG